MINTRIELLKKLLENPISSRDILIKLSDFDWDSEELIVLQKDHLENLLDLYLKKQIDLSVVEEWTNVIEGRDDIDYDKYIDVIDELSNPILYGIPSEKRIKEILENLE
ncbi:hypothetical protein [Tenacibaculum xiamenense]|uniref:hypothetical protein n=1 Tax=Tenacibaculum xiamenense TaxID=1261553 RepID=UPI0038938302